MNSKNKLKIIYTTKGILKQLSANRKRQLLLLLILMIISSFAATVNLGIIIPFLSIITDSSKILELPFSKYFINLFYIDNLNNLLLPIAILFIISTIFSSIIRLLTLWFSGVLSAAIGSDMSCKGFSKIINQDYETFIYSNSSVAINALTTATNGTVIYIRHLLEILSSLIITLGLTISLFIIEPNILISSILIISLSYLILVKIVNKYLKSSGEFITKKSIQLIQLTQDSIGAIVNIKLDNTSSIFENSYNSYEVSLRQTIALGSFLSQFPRLILEAISVVLIIMLSYVLSVENSSSFPFEKVGILVFAAQKMLPEIQKLYLGWSQLVVKESSVLEVLKIVNRPSRNWQIYENLLSFTPKKTINFSNISFSYPRKKSFVLEDINLSIKVGEIIGLVGRSGCGKSTFLNILMGLLLPTKGNLYLDDFNLHSKENHELIKRFQLSIAYVPQNFYIVDGTILENIAYGKSYKDFDIDRVLWAAKIAQIKPLIDESKFGLNSRVGEKGINLSGGQRQRLALARALYKFSKILILDEATSALDEVTEKIIFKNLYDLNVTTFIVSHRRSTLKSCDKVFTFKNGRVSEEYIDK